MNLEGWVRRDREKNMKQRESMTKGNICVSINICYIDILYMYFCCCCPLVAKLCLILCDPIPCSTSGSLSFTISWSLRKLVSIQSVMPSNHLLLGHLLLLLPSVFSSIRVFANESTMSQQWHQVTKVLGLQHQSFQ